MNLNKEHIKKPYVQKTATLTKRNINQFIRPEWHREFRTQHMNTIKNAMKRGEHPSENITVNQITGLRTHNRILNGNHRIEAIKQIFQDHPNFSIEITLTIYTNLTKEEEILVYEKINNTRRETGLDKIKANLIGAEIYEYIEKRFPCRVLFRNMSQSDRNSISAGTLLSSYINRNTKRVGGGALTMLKLIQTLKKQDYERMFNFVTFFKRVCGEPSKQNLYSSYNVFSVLAKIYYTLVGVDITEKEYELKLKNIIMRYTSQIAIYNKGIHQQKELYLFILGKLGKKKLFNVFKEE